MFRNPWQRISHLIAKSSRRRPASRTRTRVRPVVLQLERREVPAGLPLFAPLLPNGAIEPIGIATDPSGDVFVSHTNEGLVGYEFISEYAPNNQYIRSIPIVEVSSVGTLERLSAPIPGLQAQTGDILNLMPDGRIFDLRPSTGAHGLVLNLVSFAPWLDYMHIYDIQTRTMHGFPDISLDHSSYGDIAVRGNELFITGISAGNSPFVLRVVIGSQGPTSIRVMVASSAAIPGWRNFPHGVAVNDQGTVLTTLTYSRRGEPLIDEVDAPVAFDADYPEGKGRSPFRPFADDVDMASMGMTTDPAGNFYIAPGDIGSSLGGANQGVIGLVDANLIHIATVPVDTNHLVYSRDIAYDPASLPGVAHSPHLLYTVAPPFGLGQDAVNVLVAPANTSINLSVSPNPATAGQPVTIQAKVNPPGTGTLVFVDGNQLLGTPVSKKTTGDTVTITVSNLAAGRHAISAVFIPDSPEVFSNIAAPVTEVINAPAPPHDNSNPPPGNSTPPPNGTNPPPANSNSTQGSSNSTPNNSTTPPSQHGKPLAALFAVGGAGHVQVHKSADGSLVADFMPYGPSYTGPISVAMGDVNGDGTPDLVTGAMVGNPDVRVYDGKALVAGGFNPDTALLVHFFPYALQFNVGANVAVGDIEHNGYADIVTGATAGNPDVRVYHGQDIAGHTFNPDGSSLVAQWFAYGLQFNVGANVAVGDVTGDGYADVVTGANAGNPQVEVYNGRDIAAHSFNPNGSSLLARFFAFGVNFNVGAFVAVGDTNGDGFGDVIVGASSGNPQVKVYDGRAIAQRSFQNDNPDLSLLDQFYAYNRLSAGVGVSVAAADFEGTGHADILTGTTAGAPEFRIVHGDATGIAPLAVNGLDGFPSDFQGGMAVGA